MNEVSFRVMKVHEFSDSIYYQIACDCGADTCNTTLEFEIDKNIPELLFINIYKDLVWASQWNVDYTKWTWRFVDYWKRIKCALRVLFTGYIKVEESFIIRGGDHIDNFINALKEGKEKLENMRKSQSE